MDQSNMKNIQDTSDIFDADQLDKMLHNKQVFSHIKGKEVEPEVLSPIDDIELMPEKKNLELQREKFKTDYKGSSKQISYE